MVVDWRARISLAFYRASKAEPMGVELRRRFGFQHGEMTAYEDEALLSEAPLEEHPDDYSEILEAEIERPRVGPMRDIVATIQPEQDVIVRSDLEQSVCVQGAPGTGKTAVGLHRAAFLLYSHRDQLSRQGVLVVGPNASFLRYIGDVLPALGEIDAQQTTIEELVGKTLVPAQRPLRRARQRPGRRGHPEGRRASRAGRAPGAVVAGAGALRGAARAARGTTLAPRAVRGGGDPRRAARPRRPLRRRPRNARAAAGARDPGQDGDRRRLPRRPRAGRGGPQPRGEEVRRPGVAGGRPGTTRAPAAVGRALPRRRGRGCPHRAGAAAAALAEAVQGADVGAVVAGRRGADRRGGRPRGADPVARSRGGRRGAGPLTDDAARRRPPLLDRLHDRARRPGPGDDAVGEPLLGGRADPPGQGGRARRAADQGLPRARRGDRVRRAAAADDRARARAADLGAAHARGAGRGGRPGPGDAWSRRSRRPSPGSGRSG